MVQPISKHASRSESLRHMIARLFPGAELERVRVFGADDGAGDGDGEATEKGMGYGRPLRLTVRMAGGVLRDLVYHCAVSNDFGHDRRSDRAEEMLLGFDTFGSIPRHVAPVDVGTVDASGETHSIRDCGEFYLLTEFGEGALYADDLRRIGRDHQIRLADVIRCEYLAAYLASLHANKGGRPPVYTRAIRDLIGHGEGIYGIVDGFSADVPAAPAARLEAIERRCAEWRWRLRGRQHRLSLTHGDFHPFNILFDERDRLSLLDASRGCHGDPADDVTCLAINYVFFAMQEPGSWVPGYAELWHRFWREYLERTGDVELLSVAPPFLAWRILVLTNPAWYPNVTETTRDAMLSLAEHALEAGRFDPEWAEALF